MSLRLRLNELPNDRKIAAYCQVGQRGYFGDPHIVASWLFSSEHGRWVQDV